jgi:putative PEP-CTERM system histidine kinase
MTSSSLVAFSAAFFSAGLALAVFLRKRDSVASWCFIVGMLILSVESVLAGISMQALLPEEVGYWQTFNLIARSFLPGIWLCFSLTYSRGGYRESLTSWRFVLLAAFLVPVGLSLGFRNELLEVLRVPEPNEGWWLAFGAPGMVLNVLSLIANVLILMNLEGTVRSAVGTMRWRIKFVVLGLAVIFGARIFTRSQALIFSGHSLALSGVESAATLIGCTLIAVAYLRRGFADIEVYPSRAVLQSSVTVLLAGGYLLVVGVLAQVIARFGGMGDFQTQAFVVLLGVAVLAVLLLSDRFRQNMQQFVSRHFRRPQHDFRKVWARFTRDLANQQVPAGLASAAAKALSETFNALSVTIWLADEQQDRLVFSASTSLLKPDTGDAAVGSRVNLMALLVHRDPFDLEAIKNEGAEALRAGSPSQFDHGGNRLALPLVAGDRCLGFAVLADRVNGLPYSAEEKDLLKCIGEQVGAALLNLRLTGELMVGKELEAFQTMSTFFVHDLKNAASSLSLMLQNLPVHFNDPEFREDALRGIAATVDRINRLIERLSVLRNRLELHPVQSDLNQLVGEVLETVRGMSGVELVQDLNPLPQILGDRELLRSVVTNLLLNAADAVGTGGRISVNTSQNDSRAVLSVSDNGCGMSEEFVRDALFRPFQTTKKKGLGIGMFQSKMIVEAHRGVIQVESESGKGTTFRVILPLPSPTP